VRDIVGTSGNIGTARIAVAMGTQRVHEALVKFGFGTPTGIDLAGEPAGSVPALAEWDDTTLTRVAIGQDIQVTALQIIQAYCTLANGGMMPQLRVLDRTQDEASHRRKASPHTSHQGSGGTVDGSSQASDCDVALPEGAVISVTDHVYGKIDICYIPSRKSRVVSETTAEGITAALTQATQRGGIASTAAVLGYGVAGAACTVQKAVSGTNSTDRFVAGFVGYVPADDPAFVLLVLADEPKGAVFGGTLAAPVFRRIAERVFQYLAERY
jgi:cell division protein FtsI/penicillin-binding protein 2